MFAMPRFRKMLASDSARVGVCLALALLPIGNAVVMRTVTWSFWPWLLGSVLLCAVPSRPGKVGLVIETSYLALNACSSPVSIILLPHLGWRSLKARKQEFRLHAGANRRTLGRVPAAFRAVSPGGFGASTGNEDSKQRGPEQQIPKPADPPNGGHVVPEAQPKVISVDIEKSLGGVQTNRDAGPRSVDPIAPPVQQASRVAA